MLHFLSFCCWRHSNFLNLKPGFQATAPVTIEIVLDISKQDPSFNFPLWFLKNVLIVQNGLWEIVVTLIENYFKGSWLLHGNQAESFEKWFIAGLIQFDKPILALNLALVLHLALFPMPI